MHRNRHISSIPRVTMLIVVRGRGRGLRMQAGAGHPFSTHIALNCNVRTRLGSQESKCIETVEYIQHSQGHYADRSKGAWQGAENAGGCRAPFQHLYCFEL